METKDTFRMLALMVTAFGVGIDFTGALQLVPAIELGFDTNITSTQWVLNIYALFFAMTMVTGGRLGDMYGHRPIIMIGLVVFLSASVLCFLSPSLGVLVAARALQGIGAGFIWPCIIAFGATRIGTAEHRGLVMGMILAGVTTGNVFGPLISGAAIGFGDWRYFFLANVGFALLSLVTLLVLLPREETVKPDERIDFAGIAVLSLAVLMLLYALDAGADLGWTSPAILALFVGSVVFFTSFPFLEKRVREPLLPPVLLRNREFVITLALNALMVPAIFVGFLYFPQYMQRTLGWSSFGSALGLVPLTALLAIGSVISGTLYNDFGPKKLLALGYLSCTIGAALVAFSPSGWGYFQLLPGMLFLGLGATMSVGPSGTAAVGAVRPERAGLVGGLTFMAHLVYGALSVALATAIMYTVSLSRLAQDLAKDGISMSAADQKAVNGASLATDSAKAVLAKFEPAQVEKIRTVLTDAFDTGMDYAFVLAMISAATGLFLVFFLDEEKLQNGVEDRPDQDS
ncbi:MAG: MFS transporter [Pseudomonadota bacterium]